MARFRATVRRRWLPVPCRRKVLINFNGHNLFIDPLHHHHRPLARWRCWVLDGYVPGFAAQRGAAGSGPRRFATWGLMLLLGEFVLQRGLDVRVVLGTLAFTVMLAVFAAGASGHAGATEGPQRRRRSGEPAAQLEGVEALHRKWPLARTCRISQAARAAGADQVLQQAPAGIDSKHAAVGGQPGQ